MSTEELGRGRLEEAMTGSLLPLLDLKLSARAAWSPKCSYGSHVQPISSGPPSHSIRRAAACCACPARCLAWRHERGRKHTSRSRYQRSCLCVVRGIVAITIILTITVVVPIIVWAVHNPPIAPATPTPAPTPTPTPCHSRGSCSLLLPSECSCWVTWYQAAGLPRLRRASSSSGTLGIEAEGVCASESKASRCSI